MSYIFLVSLLSWQIALIAVGGALLVGLLINLLLVIRKKRKVKASDKQAEIKMTNSANAISDKFGGYSNIVSITQRGSRVTVSVVNPDLVLKKDIVTIMDNVMFMGNKVVFVIGSHSEEFQKLLSENNGKSSVANR